MSINNINLGDLTRKDFPILSKKLASGKSLIYLDHAATSQKPLKVIQTLNDYYKEYNSNVHRGAHQLSAKATQAFEDSRLITSQFINAFSSNEIVFTRNATEAINLVARSWGDSEVKEGDEILISLMEHHSNIVPWQLLSQRTGCRINYVGVTESGTLDIEDLKSKISSKTKLISLVHSSNTLGCCNPIKKINQIRKKYNTLFLVDACQSLAHQEIDVQDLGIDFLVGSSHKLCGPTGVGFLWARRELLERMPPFLGGGEMIQDVYLDKSSWAELPHKFEAGTPAIGEAIAMGEALKYLKLIGINNIEKWEKELINYLFESINSIKNISVLGPKPSELEKRGSLITFHVKGIHSEDISTLLDINGICIRSGHHCCQPLHRQYGLNSTARASISFTNTKEELDIFIEELKSAIDLLNENN